MRRFLLIITLLITYNLSFSQSNSIVNTITVKDSLRFKSLWISDISTDGLFLNPKDGLLSSQKAIKTYVDNKFNNVPFYNFTNGLKIQSNIVKLGGILTDSTSILTNNNYLNFLNYSTNDSVKFLFGKAVLYDGLAIVPGNQFYHKSITSDFITELLQYNGVIQLRSSNLAKDQFGQLATAKQGIALQTNGDLGIKLDVHASDDIANIKNSIQMNGGTSNSNASLTLQHGSKTSIQLTDNFVDLSSNDGSGNYYINRISSQNVSFYNSGDNNKFYINDDYNNAKQFMHNDITPVQISSNKLYINSNIDTTSRVLKIWGRTIGKPAIENDEYINLGQLKDSLSNKVGISKFRNGITLNGDSVVLGGILNDSTAIETKNNNLNFVSNVATDTTIFKFGNINVSGFKIPGYELNQKNIANNINTSIKQYQGQIELRSTNFSETNFTRFLLSRIGIGGTSNGIAGIGFSALASDNSLQRNTFFLKGGSTTDAANIELNHLFGNGMPSTFLQLGDSSYLLNVYSENSDGKADVSFAPNSIRIGVTRVGSKIYMNNFTDAYKQYMENDVTPIQFAGQNDSDSLNRVLKVWGRTVGKSAINDDEYINLGQLKDSLTNKVGISKFRNGISLQGDSVLLGGFLTKNTNIDLLGHSLNTFSTNGFSGGSKLEVNSGEFGLYANGTAFSYIKMYTDGVTVINSVYDAFNKGLSYASDYSANGKTDNNWIPNFGAVKSTISDSINYSSKPLTVGSNFTIGGAVYSHTRTILSTDAPTILNTDYIIYAQNSAPMTLTLPTAAGHDNQTLLIRATSLTSDAVNIIPQSGETIEGATDPIPVPTNHAIHLIARGTNWIVIAF